MCCANCSHYWNILANNGKNNATLPAAEPVDATNSVTLVKVSLAVAFSSGV